MKTNDLTWMIGGEAGFGIQSAGHIFALAAARGGLQAFGQAEYPSLIRGGHNSDVIRIADREVMVHKEVLDLLLAMNKETLDLHVGEIVEGGGVIYDADVVKDYNFEAKRTGIVPGGATAQTGTIKLFAVPLKKLAMEFGKGDITRNTVGIGASFGLVDYDIDILYTILKEMFGKKGEQIVINNIAAARAGYDYVREHYPKQFGYKLDKVAGQPRRMLITGNDALCFGALKAGCKFVAEYPMTPSSSILHFMAANAKNYNIIVKHTEDEIAAMNMVVGAGWAGVRAMTGTSGGGFSLMVEALGMGGMVEVPLVCVEVQRPGPSTGLPTRTEQCDLQFVLHASQGEYPKIVMAPGDFNECFYLAFDAFNLAEKYQTPVLILSDKHLAESVKTVAEFRDEGLKVERGKLIGAEKLAELRKKSEQVLADLKAKNPDADKIAEFKWKGVYGVSAEGNYISPDNGFLRYKLEEDGVSYRTLPGMTGGVHRAATDEHDETGDLTETPENRILMVDKRARKMENALKDLPAPFLINHKREKVKAGEADITFVTWGSPKDALLETMEMLATEGIKADLLQIVYMLPFHTKEVTEILNSSKLKVGVEMNHDAQMCALIAENTGIFMDKKILKYSGRQFTAHELYEKAKEILKK